MNKLVLFLVITPILDLFILIKLFKNMGFWTTVLLIILTGIAGCYLAITEGKVTVIKVNKELGQGKIPGNDLINALCIFLGGILLVMPGIITDIIGITLVVPPTRDFYREYLIRRFTKMIKKGNAHLFLKW